MSATLSYTLRTPVAVTANSSAGGYPASNVVTQAIKRQWRSTSAGAEWLTIDLGSALQVELVGLQGVNFASCAVKADNSATPTTSRGTLTTYTDRHGTVRGSLVLGAAVRYIRFEISAGSPLDGAAYWSIGSAYPFGSRISLPVDPLYGSEVTYDYQDDHTELPNGYEVRIERGAPKALVDLNFRPGASADLEQLARITRAQPAWLDLGASDHPYWQWPVRLRTNSHKRSARGYNREDVAIALAEVST